MPMPGDQHRPAGTIANPFEGSMPRISEYTAKDLATLQSRLDKQLGPEYISSRPGAGGTKVHYIAAEKVINLANEVFGFNGWSSQIQNVQVDFVDENPHTGKITLGLSTVIRVTLKDGTFHEDIGYGAIENCKGKAPAFEKAKKEAVTDALKRALRNFGNVLGNCLYDKDYLSKVTKVKAQPSKWAEENLHRHPDFMPLKRDQTDEFVLDQNQSAPHREVQKAAHADIEDEFGIDILDEMDITSAHPDEVVLPAQIRADSSKQEQPRIERGTTPNETMNMGRPKQPEPPLDKAILTGNQNNLAPLTHQTSEPPVGFITSRAAAALTEQNQPLPSLANLPRFDPNAESPSIRKTNGVNHSTSTPVTKNFVSTGVSTLSSNSPAQVMPSNSSIKPPATNFAHPADSTQRKIGAPTSGAPSPHLNRTSYKPPTMMAAGVKRPSTPTAVTEKGSVSRPPLTDLSNISRPPEIVASEVGGEDFKKPKIAEG